ncbi:hypothetical protein DRJ17_02040 [Candidatus Woesearchaeota archaeon]|nr:MAG: hypothetical protein DRJ17_02040 [Candidatus Woesearchaeota archaeon]
MEKEYLEKAKEELKRVDHLIFVSLKYTRTVDVIRNIIQRMIASFDFLVEGLCVELKESKKIESVPQAPGMRCNIIKEYIKDERILEFVDFYLYLRKLILSKFDRQQEFRRHVTMMTFVNGEQIKIDIDAVTEYYKKAKSYVEYIEGEK